MVRYEYTFVWRPPDKVVGYYVQIYKLEEILRHGVEIVQRDLVKEFFSSKDDRAGLKAKALDWILEQIEKSHTEALQRVDPNSIYGHKA